MTGATACGLAASIITGRIATVPVTDLWALDDLIEAYKHHQLRTRGLRERTLRGYEGHARRLMRGAWAMIPSIPPN